MKKIPYLGFGLGLRPEHYKSILQQKPRVDWFEIITENYLVPGGKPLYYLDQICKQYPVAMHGVSLSIGSCDPINVDYLKQVKKLANHIQPKWISDHLCWTGVNGLNMHDLLPLPYTNEAVKHIVSRVEQVQDFLGQQILLENVSSYLTYQQSEMTEWEFLSEIVTRSDCFILLDVNNLYVSAINHVFDPQQYLMGIPKRRVYQIHLAGHANQGNYIIDTHDTPIVDSVWDVYAAALQQLGRVSTIIERDDHIPVLEELVDELEHARQIAKVALKESVLV